jgi:hypothetical protein
MGLREFTQTKQGTFPLRGSLNPLFSSVGLIKTFDTAQCLSVETRKAVVSEFTYNRPRSPEPHPRPEMPLDSGV